MLFNFVMWRWENFHCGGFNRKESEKAYFMHHFFSEAIENLLVAKKSDLKEWMFNFTSGSIAILSWKMVCLHSYIVMIEEVGSKVKLFYSLLLGTETGTIIYYKCDTKPVSIFWSILVQLGTKILSLFWSRFPI